MMAEILYRLGTYNFNGLRIEKITFTAEVQVLQPGPISREMPTAFIAGHSYENQLGNHQLAEVMEKAQQLGLILADKYTIVTGHCPGVPSCAAKAALNAGTQVIGVSAWNDSTEHLEFWKRSRIYSETDFKALPDECATLAIHTGLGFNHRDIANIELTNNARQIVFIVGGYKGTYHETTVAVDTGAIIGALLGVGGISDDIDSLIAYYDNHGISYNIVKDTDPAGLEQQVSELAERLHVIGNDRNKPTPLSLLLDTLETKILAPDS